MSSLSYYQYTTKRSPRHCRTRRDRAVFVGPNGARKHGADAAPPTRSSDLEPPALRLLLRLCLGERLALRVLARVVCLDLLHVLGRQSRAHAGRLVAIWLETFGRPF